YLGTDPTPPSPPPLPGSSGGPGLRWHDVGPLSQALLPAGTCPQPLLPPHLPHRPEPGRRPGHLLLAGNMSSPGVPTGLAPVSRPFAADGVGGVCQAPAGRPPRGASIFGPVHAPCSHHQPAPPRL